MNGARFCVWGGGRWRSVSPSGRVSGWGRVAYVAAVGGKLRHVKRSRVLRGLRALAAGVPTSVRDGPQLSQIRLDPADAEREGRRGRQPRCVCRRPPPLALPAPAPQRNEQDVAFDLLRAANTQCGKADAAVQASAGGAWPTLPDPTAFLKDRLLADLKMDRQGDARGRKRRRSSIESREGSRSEVEICKELVIEEGDVMVLRHFIEVDEGRTFPADLLRFDTDDEYKRTVFFWLNPIVMVERSRSVERALRERAVRERAVRERAVRARSGDGVPLRDFAHSLGLWSVEERSEQSSIPYRMRKRLPRPPPLAPRTDTDKENARRGLASGGRKAKRLKTVVIHDTSSENGAVRTRQSLKEANVGRQSFSGKEQNTRRKDSLRTARNKGERSYGKEDRTNKEERIGKNELRSSSKKTGNIICISDEEDRTNLRKNDSVSNSTARKEDRTARKRNDRSTSSEEERATFKKYKASSNKNDSVTLRNTARKENRTALIKNDSSSSSEDDRSPIRISLRKNVRLAANNNDRNTGRQEVRTRKKNDRSTSSEEDRTTRKKYKASSNKNDSVTVSNNVRYTDRKEERTTHTNNDTSTSSQEDRSPLRKSPRKNYRIVDRSTSSQEDRSPHRKSPRKNDRIVDRSTSSQEDRSPHRKSPRKNDRIVASNNYINTGRKEDETTRKKNTRSTSSEDDRTTVKKYKASSSKNESVNTSRKENGNARTKNDRSTSIEEDRSPLRISSGKNDRIAASKVDSNNSSNTGSKKSGYFPGKIDKIIVRNSVRKADRTARTMNDRSTSSEKNKSPLRISPRKNRNTGQKDESTTRKKTDRSSSEEQSPVRNDRPTAIKNGRTTAIKNGRIIVSKNRNGKEVSNSSKENKSSVPRKEEVRTESEKRNVQNEVKKMPDQAAKRTISSGREYSLLEDAAIVRWVASGARARLVNGNRLWRELQPIHQERTGKFRSWHSLRNRYLRSLLPRLAEILPADATRLRAAAASGELKARKIRSNSIYKSLRERGAWSRRPRSPPTRSPSPLARSPSPSVLSGSETERSERRGRTGLRKSTIEQSQPTKCVLRSSTAAPSARTPRTRALSRTPTYSEVTRRFARRRRPSGSPPRDQAPRARTRKLYNPV